MGRMHSPADKAPTRAEANYLVGGRSSSWEVFPSMTVAQEHLAAILFIVSIVGVAFGAQDESWFMFVPWT